MSQERVEPRDLPTSGHPGFERSLERVRQRFVWFGLRGDVKDYVSSCEQCNINKGPPRHARHNLIERMATYRLETVHIDFVGPLSKTSTGHRYILTLVDKFTKWVEAIPTKDCTAETAAKALLQVFYNIGFPQTIVSDRGRSFENNLITQLCKTLGIQKKRTSSYRPAANGACERTHKILMASIRC